MIDRLLRRFAPRNGDYPGLLVRCTLNRLRAFGGQQEQTQPEQQKAAQDQRGTEQLPLIVQPLPTKKTAEIAQKEGRDADEKTNSDWWTWLLGILTIAALFGQLIVFIAQAYFLKGTLNATAAAAKAGTDSVAAAEAAFNKLERPYIFISHAQKFSHDDKRAPMGIASVRYEVGNHGKTPAIIENVRAIISSGTEPDIPIRVDDQHELFVSRVVPPLYTYHPIEDAPDGIDFVASEDEIVPQLKEGEDIFLWIIVSYRGAFTKGHETSACWRYDGSTNRLTQWGHDDYNYVK